jgi:DNA invertase Pin-like site-specific DNA recombinase
MGVFAEFERAIIQERVWAGLAKARAQGKRLGRPKVSASVERSILAARANGKGTGWNNTGNNEASSRERSRPRLRAARAG